MRRAEIFFLNLRFRLLSRFGAGAPPSGAGSPIVKKNSEIVWCGRTRKRCGRTKPFCFFLKNPAGGGAGALVAKKNLDGFGAGAPIRGAGAPKSSVFLQKLLRIWCGRTLVFFRKWFSWCGRTLRRCGRTKVFCFF